MPLIEFPCNATKRELRPFAEIWFPGSFAVVGGIVNYGTGPLGTAPVVWGPMALLSGIGFPLSNADAAVDSVHLTERGQTLMA